MIVLSLCDYTGNMVRPWADAGYQCVCVDLQHAKGEAVDGNITYVGADLHHWVPPYGEDYAIGFAFTDCTNLSVSGARWFKQKGLRGLIDGLELFERARVILETLAIPHMMENPISTLSTYYRKPDYKFDPCDYGGYLNPPGDTYTKKTCLWAGGGFVIPEPRRVEPVEGSKMHLLPPSDDRANLRSETPMGFAQAVFEANKRKVI